MAGCVLWYVIVPGVPSYFAELPTLLETLLEFVTLVDVILLLFVFATDWLISPIVFPVTYTYFPTVPRPLFTKTSVKISPAVLATTSNNVSFSAPPLLDLEIASTLFATSAPMKSEIDSSTFLVAFSVPGILLTVEFIFLIPVAVSFL